MSEIIRVQTRKPKHPPIKDGNQVAYLLLHVHLPSYISPVPSVHHLDGVKSAQRVGKVLGFKIWPIRLTWSHDSCVGLHRYLFRFPRYQRDDQRAQQIAECFLHGLALTFGPFMGPNEVASVFRVPADLVRKSHTVSGDMLVQVEEARSYGARTLEFPHTLGSSISISEDYFDEAWKITPVLFQNEVLYRAVRFLKASQDDFFVWPGQINEVIANSDMVAPTSFEQLGFENALQNAFKSIEAVLGDPPTDDSKFFAKMESIGLEPDEEVGYANRIPLHKVIRAMNKARDKKAAHGSTRHRTITCGELMEYQACARMVVWVAIENRLGEHIYD
jgi:hypothetical protein